MAKKNIRNSWLIVMINSGFNSWLNRFLAMSRWWFQKTKENRGFHSDGFHTGFHREPTTMGI